MQLAIHFYERLQQSLTAGNHPKDYLDLLQVYGNLASLYKERKNINECVNNN